MSLPSIRTISNSARTTDAAATSMPIVARTPSAATAAPDTTATGEPPPLRFPWLSRLSQQLEAAARQKPAFPSAPVLGDNIDKAV